MGNKPIILPFVLGIVGPTGSGKTAISIELAKYYNACIINLDSVQIYSELNIGSAKPSAKELQTIEHYLVNISSIVEPKNSFFIFQESYNLIKDLYGKRNIILTGGTGLYYKSLLYGMFSGDNQNKQYCLFLDSKDTSELFTLLQKVDSIASKKIHPNDKVRIIRALEVYHTTGKSIYTHHQEQKYTPPANFLIVGIDIPREILYSQINHRVLEMIQQGLVEETSGLKDKNGNFPELLNKIIGYKEVIPYLQGSRSLEETIAVIQKNTRRYAKRQLTLFRHIDNIHWITNPTPHKIIDYIKGLTSIV